MRQKSLLKCRGFIQFDREVLEVLAAVVTAGADVCPEFQQLANEAMARALAANSLPSRPSHRINGRVSDDAEKMKAVRSFLERRKGGETVEEASANVAEGVVNSKGKSVDGRTIQRWKDDAFKEARHPSPETVTVSPEQVLVELGLNPEVQPPLGTPWVLHVVEHGSANRRSSASDDDLPPPPWLTGEEEEDR